MDACLYIFRFFVFTLFGQIYQILKSLGNGPCTTHTKQSDVQQQNFIFLCLKRTLSVFYLFYEGSPYLWGLYCKRDILRKLQWQFLSMYFAIKSFQVAQIISHLFGVNSFRLAAASVLHRVGLFLIESIHFCAHMVHSILSINCNWNMCSDGSFFKPNKNKLNWIILLNFSVQPWSCPLNSFKLN